MWATTHIASGTMLYDATSDERWKWVRWPLLVFACFVTHWLLDSTAVYHYFTWKWWDCLFVAWQVIGAAWLLWWCGWKQFLAGVIAWLIWDIEWVFRWFGWVGQEGFFHKYLTAISSHGYHFTAPVTGTLEGLLLLALIWVSRPHRRKKPYGRKQAEQRE